MITTLPELLDQIDAYKRRAKCKDSTVSLRIFNDGKRLKALRKKNARMWPETIAKAAQKLADLEGALSEQEVA